ncbi:MAG TPA: C1 family peptidase, partial [Candidatus Krumholzibacterium sp.]|nr:C1 family peptidase [Candidatus Krumholzibacterium sp.]
LLDLSEQALISCNIHDYGCNGGVQTGSYEIYMNEGAVSEDCMPYEASNSVPCDVAGCERLAYINSYAFVPNSVSLLKAAILQYGPISVAMYAHDNLSSYSSGCYSADYADPINHAVLLIGWDDSACGGDGAWLVKNSWGTSWGYDGVGYIQYGVCSIGTQAFSIDYTLSDVALHVDSPNGGETLEVGEGFDILWTTSRQTPDSISILLSLNSGLSYDSTIVTGLDGTAESYLWTVPEFPVTTARIRINAWYGGTLGGFDFSDADFTITGPPYRYVSPTGGNVYPYTLPRWAARNIQNAIDAANPGDSIMVEGNSTYSGAVIVSAPLWLLGGWNEDFSMRDPEAYETTISSVGSPVSFQYILSGSCGIDGFTITNGTGRGDVMIPFSGNYGGAIFIYNASPVIRNNVLRGNGYISPVTASYGGAISGYNADIVVEDNTITGNRAQSGGSVYLYNASATIRNNRISGATCNSEYTGEKNGGGIYALHASLDLENNYIGGTSGYRTGGGIYGRFSTITVSGDSIDSNSTTSNGGGIYTERSALALTHGVITGNNSAGQGGGIYHCYEHIDMANTIIAMNHASIIGGGMAADSAWGAIRNNTFDRNGATFGGGNVMLSFMETTDFSSNLITYGLKYGVQATGLANITMAYNGLFGNFPGDYLNITPDATNTSRDPHYADTTSFDYHLGAHSGAIDAGDPLGETDPDGSRADQGAFGGPGADFAAPDYITGLVASTAPGDSIRLE